MPLPNHRRPLWRLAVWLLPAILALACGSGVDVQKALQVADVTTGWLDAGVVQDKNKLVPTISFRLRNVSDASVNVVQINGVFKRMQEEDEWGTVFARVIGSEGVKPGDATGPIVLRSQLGYTGEQPRTEILQHSQFIDARVQLFAKHGSARWVKLAEYPIERQLLTQ